jgi:hypothetical protein
MTPVAILTKLVDFGSLAVSYIVLSMMKMLCILLQGQDQLL